MQWENNEVNANIDDRDMKSIEWGRSTMEEGQDWSKFISATKDGVSVTNGYSGKLGDEET